MAARKKAAATLPKGFTAITGFGESWPNDKTKEGDMLVGTLVEYEVIKLTRDGKKVDVQQAKIEDDDGKIFTVWESAGLAGIFDDDDYTDCRIAILYKGLGKKKPGQNAPKLYEIGVED